MNAPSTGLGPSDPAAKADRTDSNDSVPFRSPYPSYQVLAKWDSPSFDEATRRVVAHRLQHVPQRKFLEPNLFAVLRAVVDCVLPQPERDEQSRIPVEAFIDDMLQKNLSNGTRFDGTPAQRTAWVQGLQGIDREAQRRHGGSIGFAALPQDAQHRVLSAIDAGEVNAEEWKGLDPKRFFRSILLNEAVKSYYAHPSAWNEIGFGGPAAPRGYVRLGFDEVDPWEATEERHPQPVKGRA